MGAALTSHSRTDPPVRPSRRAPSASNDHPSDALESLSLSEGPSTPAPEPGGSRLASAGEDDDLTPGPGFEGCVSHLVVNGEVSDSTASCTRVDDEKC